MLAKVHASVLQGIDAIPCEVEVDLAEREETLPKPSIVGLPDMAVKESADRIRSAIANCGFIWPMGRLIINLAPADLKKEGNALELPVAMGILAVSRVIKTDRHKRFLIGGELALDGRVRSDSRSTFHGNARSRARHGRRDRSGRKCQ